MSEAVAIADAQALVRQHSSAGCVCEWEPVATRKTAQTGGETRAGLPNCRPRSPLPGDAHDGRREAGTATSRRRKCRVRPTFITARRWRKHDLPDSTMYCRFAAIQDAADAK